MLKAVARRLLLFGACCCAFAQNTARFEFEVASIKPSPEPDPNQGYTVGCKEDPGMFRCQNMDLSNLITRAYSIMPFQLTGPDWMRSQRFEITAKIPEGTTKEQLDLMLQSMLTDRFKLVVHHETKDMAKYDLVVAKNGTKLKAAVEDAAGAAPADKPRSTGPMKLGKDGFPELSRPGMIGMNGRFRFYQPAMTMQQLVRQLSGQMGKPVTDATGLKGKYDISLYWAADMMRGAAPLAAGGAAPLAAAPEGDSGPTLEQAIQDQLGLHLEAKKGPVDFLVVDHIEKLPTDN